MNPVHLRRKWTGDLKMPFDVERKENVPIDYVGKTTEGRARNRALNRKLDFHLLPALSPLYLFNGLDRGNVGNAQTQGTVSFGPLRISGFQAILT